MISEPVSGRSVPGGPGRFLRRIGSWRPHGRGLVKALRVVALAVVWAMGAFAVGTALFFSSTTTTTVASHEVTLAPVWEPYVTVRTGPVLPDVRVRVPDSAAPAGLPLGLEVGLGKTTAADTEELLTRYAVIASNPDGTQARVKESLLTAASRSYLRGAAVATVPWLLWWLVGPTRRRELAAATRQRLRSRPARCVAVSMVAVALGAAVVVQPNPGDGNSRVDDAADGDRWVSLGEYLEPVLGSGSVRSAMMGTPGQGVPASLAGVELRGDATTASTRRLIASAVETYESSRVFYTKATFDAAGLELRRPGENEVAVVVVSDRHDNIGMDAPARAVGDNVGATVVFNAGDDTSTGSSWEGFSLDSVDAAFEGYERFAVTGNHDHGDFVGAYLLEHGWTMLDGSVVQGPGGGTLLGVGDPRSSGLGSWRDETGLSFAEVGERLADAACAHRDKTGAPVSTVLVHDANLADEALNRGCVDVVVGGHLHTTTGPDEVVGPDGEVGFSFTTGTTGGAAYAFAALSKPRREATVSVLTYREGRVVGVQTVTLATTGQWSVGEYVALRRPTTLEPTADAAARESRRGSAKLMLRRSLSTGGGTEIVR